MAERNILPNTSRYAQTETDNLYKELEPDANQVMFGQKNLPDRPLTTKEVSKRKKIIMKLVDQRLKFKLIELMGQQVASKNNIQRIETTATIPTVDQTINHSQPLHSFASYQSQSQPNWFPYSGSQYAEGNWPQPCQTEWQSSIYPPQYGAAVDTSWNTNCGYQPNIQSNVLPNIQSNVQYFHQNSKPDKPLKRKTTQNLYLLRPVVDATTISNVISKTNKVATRTSADVQEKPNEKVSASCSSSLILVRTKIV